MRKLSKREKAQIWSEIDNQGLGYWCQNYGSVYEQTELEPLIKQAREALNKLDDIISDYEQYVRED